MRWSSESVAARLATYRAVQDDAPPTQDTLQPPPHRTILEHGIDKYLLGTTFVTPGTTCCWYSYSSLQRTPNDFVLVSDDAMASSRPSLQGAPLPDAADFSEEALAVAGLTGGQRPNESYSTQISEVEYEQLLSLAETVQLSEDVYSDHVPSSRQVLQRDIVTLNASFVLLRMQAQLLQMKHEQGMPFSDLLEGIGGKTHGSEGMAALAIAKRISKYFGEPDVYRHMPFYQFVLRVGAKHDVILLQEWVSGGSAKGGDVYTNAYFAAFLRHYGYSLFETHSGYEGSCIAFRPEAAVKIIEDDDVAALNDAEFWAWCGIEGRTWSVVEFIGGGRGDAHALCINLHAPNSGADSRAKETVGPFATAMSPYFSEHSFTRPSKPNKKYNRYIQDLRAAHALFLDALLVHPVPEGTSTAVETAIRKIRECYEERCAKRLVVGGDWNEASKIPKDLEAASS